LIASLHPWPGLALHASTRIWGILRGGGRGEGREKRTGASVLRLGRDGLVGYRSVETLEITNLSSYYTFVDINSFTG
jgi:hypothetical protein